MARLGFGPSLPARVHRIDATVSPAQSGLRIDVVYHFASLDAANRNPLWLDIGELPVTLEGVEGIGLRVADVAPGTIPRSRLVEVEVERDGGWDESSLAMQFHWPHLAAKGAHPQCVIGIPDFLPWPYRPRMAGALTREPLPLIDFAYADFTSRQPSGGIAAYPPVAGGSPNNEYLQALILRADGQPVSELEIDGVVFSPNAVRLLDRTARREIASVIGASLEMIAELLQIHPKVRIVAATLDDFPAGSMRPAGALMTRDGASWRELAEGDERKYLRLTQHLAAVWLAGGARIVGPLDVEIVAGLSLTISVVLIEQNTGRRFTTADWQSEIRTVRPMRLPGPFAGGRAPELARDLLLALGAFAEAGGDLPELLRRIVRESWGHLVPTRHVVNWMRNAGVILPQPFERM